MNLVKGIMKNSELDKSMEGVSKFNFRIQETILNSKIIQIDKKNNIKN